MVQAPNGSRAEPLYQRAGALGQGSVNLATPGRGWRRTSSTSSRLGWCAALAASLIAGTALSGCEHRSPDTSSPTNPSKPSATPVSQPEPAAETSAKINDAPAAKKETTAQAQAAARKYETTEPASWRLSEISDVAPAGPATATSKGVVMATLSGDLVRGDWQSNGTVTPIHRNKSDFAAYGRGPAFSGGYGYWIRQRYLLRRKLGSKDEPQVLARDAREGTRVAAEQVGKPGKTVVAYIAESEERLFARLWIEGGQQLELTPEGSQATSVNLVPNGDELMAVILEGRTSMSPVHARRLLLRGKIPRAEDDVVVWVGPPSQPLSEIVTLPRADGGARVFLALERTVTDFGLANFQIPQHPKMNVSVDWLDYPNGINPAPVAAGSACGKPLVLFAQPSEARPRSPQELRVARLEGTKLSEPEVIARSRAFNNISIASVKGGALITWTADWRTWARTIFCK